MKQTDNKFLNSIFIFRRDLRLDDNSGLIKALKESDKVIPIFIFDNNQIDKNKNDYFSENAFQFMLNSLKELNKDLQKKGSKLFIYQGEYEKIIESLISENKIDAIYMNKDYTPFSRKRDGVVKKICDKCSVNFFRVDDYTLSPIEIIETQEHKKYSVFTPFMKKARTYQVLEIIKNKNKNYFSTNSNLKSSFGEVKISKLDIYNNNKIMLIGGRSEALKMMKKTDFFKKYKNDRNLPAIEGTSKLSAHIKFGTVSIREIYYWAEKGGASDQFISELYWRDFYLYISYHFPFVFGKSFQQRGDKIKWRNSKKEFEKWKVGKTGVPIVDAGMRQLNEIGWMHNRVRMIVASYLTKNLLIDWRWGEKYFAQKLIDYDPSSNNGGWQWSASVGADPKPIRIFNPYTQVQKYDPQALYIKKWVHELKDVEEKILTSGKDVDFSEFGEYPKPLVDQKDSYHRAMNAYRVAKK